MTEILFKDIRKQSEMNLTQFSKYFEIPYRTVQDWEYGKRKCPEYLLKLMRYKLENERIGNEQVQNETI